MSKANEIAESSSEKTKELKESVIEAMHDITKKQTETKENKINFQKAKEEIDKSGKSLCQIERKHFGNTTQQNLQLKSTKLNLRKIHQKCRESSN